MQIDPHVMVTVAFLAGVAVGSFLTWFAVMRVMYKLNEEWERTLNER